MKTTNDNKKLRRIYEKLDKVLELLEEVENLGDELSDDCDVDVNGNVYDIIDDVISTQSDIEEVLHGEAAV